MAYEAELARLRAMLERGFKPLTDHDLIAATSSVVAAAGTSTVIPVRPYEPGAIVSISGVAYAPGGDAEADTMSDRMHEKYLAAQIKVGGRPKTNDLFEPLFLLCPPGGKGVLWPVAAQDLIETTFTHLATAGIASLHGRIVFGFIPFSVLRG